MRTPAFTAMLIACIALPATALVARDSGRHGGPPRLPYQPMAGPAGAHLGGQIRQRVAIRHGGGWNGNRWHGVMRAPGGWGAYHRPSRGWILPPYWIGSGFGIGDYGAYGLAPPPEGYGWSRYYDDAVLLDRSGRVYDSVEGIDWRDEDYGEDGRSRDYDYDYDGVTDGGHYRGTWRGTWTGSYDGGPVTRYGGEYRGEYDGDRWRGHAPAGGGYVSGGYYFPAPTITTVTVQAQPVVTTTRYIEERYVAPKKTWHAKPKRTWKPRPKARCRCG